MGGKAYTRVLRASKKRRDNMNSDVSKRTLKELDTLGIRYAKFFGRFRDVALETKGKTTYLKLVPRREARGPDRLYLTTSPPGSRLEVL